MLLVEISERLHSKFYLNEQVFDTERLSAVRFSTLDRVYRSRECFDRSVVIPNRERRPLSEIDIVVH
jgi:hypothetical protein